MNYNNRMPTQRRSPKKWWRGLATMWENFFIAVLIVIVAIIGYLIYLFTGDAILYIGGGIVALLFVWAFVALVREF